MRCRTHVAAVGGAAVLLVLAGQAWAIIKVDQPISKTYGMAAQVVVGKVTKVDAAAKRVDAAVEETIKGTFSAASVAVEIPDLPEVMARAAVGQPLVILVGKVKGAALHLADTWLVAEMDASANPPVFRATQRLDRMRGFPGPTVALIAYLKDLKAGRATLVEKCFHHFWGTVREVADLKLNASSMAAADVNGDKKDDLLVLATDGLHLLTAKGTAYADEAAAWGLRGAKARQAAFGDADGDGRPDLLADALWMNAGTQFVPSKTGVNLAPLADLLAVALADVTGDRKADAVALGKDGTLTVYENPGGADQAWRSLPARRLWQGGEEPYAAVFGPFGADEKWYVIVIRPSDVTRYALDADGGPPADFVRLTGEERQDRYFPMADFASAAAIDYNGGDGLMDLYIATRQGGAHDIGLVNRGYGAFFTNTEARLNVAKNRGVSPAAIVAADTDGDGTQRMMVLTREGRLILFDSPPRDLFGKPGWMRP